MNSKNVRYDISTEKLKWKRTYWSQYWRDDLYTIVDNMKKTPWNSFILAMILCEVKEKFSTEQKNDDDIFINYAIFMHYLNHLYHEGGCLYSIHPNYIDEAAITVQKILDDLNLDIKLEKKNHNNKNIYGFVLGKKYTAEYKRLLITLWKLQGKI